MAKITIKPNWINVTGLLSCVRMMFAYNGRSRFDLVRLFQSPNNINLRTGNNSSCLKVTSVVSFSCVIRVLTNACGLQYLLAHYALIVAQASPNRYESLLNSSLLSSK